MGNLQNDFYYFFSTTIQSIAALTGLLGGFIIFRYGKMLKDIDDKTDWLLNNGLNIMQNLPEIPMGYEYDYGQKAAIKFYVRKFVELLPKLKSHEVSQITRWYYSLTELLDKHVKMNKFKRSAITFFIFCLITVLLGFILLYLKSYISNESILFPLETLFFIVLCCFMLFLIIFLKKLLPNSFMYETELLVYDFSGLEKQSDLDVKRTNSGKSSYFTILLGVTKKLDKALDELKNKQK